MGANETSTALWRQRELLEMLLFKLEEEQLLLTAGRTRWLAHSTREVEQVLARLRDAGLGLSLAVSALADEWGAPSDASLRQLIAHAPEGPWAEIFENHLTALTELTAEIQQIRDLNDQFLRTALRSTQETLADLTPDAGTYDANGRTDGNGNARLLDERL